MPRINMTEGMLKHEQPEFHFLATNPFEWFITDDLREAITTMDKKKVTYWIWYVPGSKETPYEIRFYQPQVEGSFVLGCEEFKNNRRIDAK